MRNIQNIVVKKFCNSEGSLMMVFQQIIDSIEGLSIEDQDYLFELIRKRRIENRRQEILANSEEVMKSFENGTAKKRSVDDLIADLLRDDDASCLE